MSIDKLKQTILMTGAVMMTGLSGGCIISEDNEETRSTSIMEEKIDLNCLDDIMLPLTGEGTYDYRQRLIRYNKAHPDKQLKPLTEDSLIMYLEKKLSALTDQGGAYDSASDFRFINAVSALTEMRRIQRKFVQEEEKRIEAEINEEAFSKRIVNGVLMPTSPQQSIDNYRMIFNSMKDDHPELISIEHITTNQIQNLAVRLAISVSSVNSYVAERVKLTILRLHADFEKEKNAKRSVLPHGISHINER